ncbi:hypothetical protein KCP76_02610 [Salmonella enterica subsp. enterica serovar Weltevreden]|nr:hypothetical protein KCP76_02610 [Salmonella enterica subsp. enterica serovar Weltevreden]
MATTYPHSCRDFPDTLIFTRHKHWFVPDGGVNALSGLPLDVQDGSCNRASRGA